MNKSNSMYFKNGFFEQPIEGAIKISKIYWRELIEAQSNGFVIRTNKDGYPIAVKIDDIELSYREKRALEYPSIQEQLDMLYWDKVNQTNLWQEAISAVKAEYPKEQK